MHASRENVFARPSSHWIWATAVAFTVAIFVADLLIPSGLATSVLYVLVVLLTLWLPSQTTTWSWAAVCTALIVAGYFLSPAGGIQAGAVANRVVAVLSTWVTAALSNAEKRSASTFRLAVEQAPLGVLIADQQGRIAFANRGVEALFGYSSHKLEGLPVEVLVPQRFKDGHLGHRRLCIEQAESRPMGSGRDLYGVRKDGTEIPIEIGLAPFRTYRGLLILCTIVDIADRKRAEQRVSSQNRELQTLLQAISHDLREPLRGIEGFARLLEERSASRLDERGLELLTRVRNASARLRSLVDDLLALSRARHARAPRKPLDLRRLTDEVLTRLGEVIEEKGARVDVIGDFPRPRVDPKWAREAIFNLVSNALKFTRPGRAADIEIEGVESNEQSGLVVRDRGPGVRSRNFERIFQLFQRAHGREIEGTGAGLAIVKAIAECHGGRAWVQPRPGGGSEFFITFGRTAEEHRRERAAEQVPTPDAKNTWDVAVRFDTRRPFPPEEESGKPESTS